ncbi:MAG: hypothetical protein PHT16_03585 [Candidatus Pacebacteria bacterium]|nr:hypothetical protein [Candidatus Paceibacterota bacterium]
MNIGEYIKEYSNGEKITFLELLLEVRELITEIIKFNKKGIHEEFEDVLHFLQLWLYWRFGINGEIWKITRNSVKKFMDRKLVWREIYLFVGLPKGVSNFCGNYKRVQKVVSHLQKFGVNLEKAEEAHRKIVLKTLL